MKIKILSILLITCILLTACNNSNTAETTATVESVEPVEAVTEIDEQTTVEETESTEETVESTEGAKTVEEEPTTEETETREGTEGDSSAMDIQTPESKPTPESITPQSSVEDMIAAYPDEITPELQSKLDEVNNFYEQGLLTDEMYKEDTYITLYGPSKEERQAEIERIMQELENGATQSQSSNTEIPDALKALESHGSNSGKTYDPNYQVSDNLKGAQCY